jgi:glycosyltransferase involved in cell wall biosynthesis
MSAPFFSLIVVCRNADRTLAATLTSVAAQTETDRELVVIDGASTDGTAGILASHRSAIATLVSEPDGGVYAAMNKGARLARGRWLLFLGADDVLVAPDTLAHARTALASAPDDSVMAGEAAFDDGRIWRLHPRRIYRSFVHHQATFYPRGLLARHPYDETLRIQGDYDLNLRLARSGVAFRALPLLVARCASGGLSDGGRWANYREEIAVRHRHYPAPACWFWDLLSVLRFFRKKLHRSRRRHS